jgi:hypothetical protein
MDAGLLKSGRTLEPLPKVVPYLDGFRQLQADNSKMATLRDFRQLQSLIDSWRFESEESPENKLYHERKAIFRGSTIDGSPWALELIAKPKKDGHFIIGTDVVDFETGWRLSGSELAKATGGDPTAPYIALLITPLAFEGSDEKPVVIPQSLVVVDIQASGVVGKIDLETGMIMKVKNPNDLQFRNNWRVHGTIWYRDYEFLGPFIMGASSQNDPHFSSRNIDADILPTSAHGLVKVIEKQ